MAQLVISLSMLLTPLLFLGYEALSRRLSARHPERPADVIDEKGAVIIAGVGRFGQVVNRLVRNSGVPTVVLDSDMAMIDTLRRFGVKGYYGDPSRPELLEAAGLSEAQVLVVAVDEPAKAVQIVKFVRGRRPDIHIVARAFDRVHVYELYQAGANDIVRETFDSSVRAGRYVLENMGFSEYEAANVSKAFFRLDRVAMRDLAELWVPGQPVDRNPAYIERAKKLDRDLETALIQEIYELRPMDGTKD
jgi:CPA2 family monovalent cation:H+ antiporter-2